MPIQICVDDSGGPNQSAQVMAGPMGTAEQWALFSDQWADALSQPPAATSLHMNEINSWHLADPQRDEKLRRLCRVIDSFGFTVLYVSFDMEGFGETFQRFETRPLNHPYFHVFHGMIMCCCMELYAMQGLRERFEIIFDENLSLGERAKRWYPMTREALQKAEPEAATILPIEPLFRTDEDFLPLQAADLFAWLRRRRLSDGAKPHPFEFLQAEFRNTRLSPWSTHFDKARLHQAMKRHGWDQPDAL